MKRLIYLLVPSLMLIAGSAWHGSTLAQSSDFLAVAQDPTLGAILTDAKGMTVYLYTLDTEAGQGACSDECAANFPPVPAADMMALPAGVPGTLAAFDRTDGTKQAAYNGIPLYYFAHDTQPGDVDGQGVGNIWFVVPPGSVLGPYPAPTDQGTPVPAMSLRVGFTTDLGPFLSDSMGMTLYIFMGDQPGMSTCTGDCATEWPPLAVTDSLELPVGIGGTLTSITRDDGSLQVAYNDSPLYIFAGDTQPGDVTGQNQNDFVVATVSAGATAAPPMATAAAVEAIQIMDFAFSPDTLQVAVGTTVTWTNGDSTTHTVTADDGSFDLGEVEPGKSVSFTFTTPGTYAYHCAIHPFMMATIVVT